MLNNLILIYFSKPEELFSEFDQRPLGTASLAQVHRAKLKDSNQEVAVKVQHRYVKNHSMGDIYTCEFLVHTVKFFFPQFEFMWLAEVSVQINILSAAFTNSIKQYKVTFYHIFIVQVIF